MDTFLTILKLVCEGAWDCLNGSVALKNIITKRNKICKETSKTPKSRASEPAAQSKTVFEVFVQCIVFGFLIWFAIFIFQKAVIKLFLTSMTQLFPSEEENILIVAQFMNVEFSMLWKCPMFFVSRILTFVWYQDIANMTCEDVGIKKQVTQSKSNELSEQLMSACVQTLFLIQGYLMYIVPIPRYFQHILSTLNLALLYSLYAFEYRWCQKGWAVTRRLSYIECKWPYFVGFGLPLAILTSCVETYIESICVFSVLFPVTLITSTVTFNESLQSFNKPFKFFGLAYPIADCLVNRSVDFLGRRK